MQEHGLLLPGYEVVNTGSETPIPVPVLLLAKTSTHSCHNPHRGLRLYACEATFRRMCSRNWQSISADSKWHLAYDSSEFLLLNGHYNNGR